MLNFDQSDNAQVQGLTAQIKSTPGFAKTDQEMVAKAWDLAKSKADNANVDKNDVGYWDTITNQAKTDLGIQLPNTPRDGSSMTFQKNTSIDPMKTTANMNGNNKLVVEKSKKVREEQSSDAFIGTVPENASVPGFGGQTGPEINSEAKKRIDLMRKKGFGTSF